VSWVNYVHNLFHDRNSATDVRRRHLVLDLSKHENGVSISKVTSLSAELPKEYFGKTPKTLVRDLNELVGMGLIERKRGTVRAKREVILAFLPWRTKDQSGNDQQAA
jgi:DeoR/GlpR family transcriptional regulator of sugar metabolism